jgi:hypothetical protein
MRPENIPRRQERFILADATQKFERLLITRIFATHDIAAFAELAHIARVCRSLLHLLGRPATQSVCMIGSRSRTRTLRPRRGVKTR